jgi:hypothetical protein
LNMGVGHSHPHRRHRSPAFLAEISMDVIGGGVGRLHSRCGIFTVIGPSPWLRSPRRHFVAL